MNDAKRIYVFDTSAWFALIEDEAGADVVQSILESTRSGDVDIFVSFMSFMEVFYITLQEHEIEEAQARVRLMESLPIRRVESSVSLCESAARLKARYRMSVADAWIAALAQEKDATLLHKDPEFECIQDELQVLRLP